MIVSPIINYNGGAVAVRNSGDTFPIDGGSDGIEGSYGRIFSPVTLRINTEVVNIL